MSAYVILDLSIHDPQEIINYQKLAPQSFADFGGKIIVRGGQLTTLEGDWSSDRLVIVEFASVERAKEWYNSELYRKASVHRNKAATTRMIIVEGV
jgi:uncharacterized protein (DUF1330 family)